MKERDTERLELAELVDALKKLAPRNALAAKVLLQLRYGDLEETRIDFKLTIVDPGGEANERRKV